MTSGVYERLSLEDRFWSKVNKNKSCWEWIGAKFSSGYGVIRVSGKSKRSHRVSYELNVGPIPEGMSVLHKCDNPVCVNPVHLFVGTQQDNMKDRGDKGRTAKGEDSGVSKLTRKQVDKIRDEYKNTKTTHAELGKKYNICRSQITCVINRKNWA